MYMDALIGLHTRLERGGLTKANLTNEVMNITQKITEKADNIEKHVKKSTEEIQKKDNKIRDLQKYNSTLFTKLTQMKNERNSLQQTLNEVFGENAFPGSKSQASSGDRQALQSVLGIIFSQLSTPTRKCASTVSSPLTPTRLFSPASSSNEPEHTEPGPSKTPPDSQKDVFGDQEIKNKRKNRQ